MLPEMKKYDVAVVGAGPAGSTAAYYAASGGASVLLIDRKKDIGTPVQCGGFIPCYDEIGELLPDAELPATLRYPRSCAYTSTKVQRFISPSLEPKEFKVDADVLDRKQFDKYLAREAARKGAELLVGTRVTAVHGSELALHGMGGEGTVSASVIIGADGPYSLVAQSAGLTGAPDPMGLAVALEYEFTGVDADRDAVEMYFGRDYVPGGYGWIIPEGNDTANVGIGIRKPLCEEGMTVQDYLQRFVHEHPSASKKLEGGEITAIISGSVPVGGAPERTAAGNVLIAGDAASHLIATNGGGIPTAMVAGKIAGETAADHVSGKCELAAYEKRWRSQMGLEISTSVYVRKLMDGLMRSDSLMSTAMKLITTDQMKSLQRGRLPEQVKKLLTGMNMQL